MQEAADAPVESDVASEEEPAPSFAKRVVDPVNSITWFTMDALWMCKLAWPAYVFAGFTVATGTWLLVLGWRQKRGLLLADFGLNCWIAMNTVWMVTDLNGQPTPFGLTVPLAIVGALFLAIAAWYSQDIRRLRIRGR